ncbi:amidase-domain-containing protein [Ophiobolus disseminans]|uniref:Glutamyl-tRNA(Gln) amidotransferase subunit A, mitochondrial n=1 Tax=Ophiobolus disseminans TaxID=1469910 RepID=A0A6A7A6B9_9PLEO|nr:amidase-domain-containing protein [Ophiobolus disseminans]
MSLLKYAKQYVVNQLKYAHLNAFISRTDPSSLTGRPPSPDPKDAESGLHSVYDKPIAIKDNICTKDFKTTAASGILKDFTSPYDATVVKLLQDAGAVMVGKTNMDEFGMGSHSTHSHAGPVKMQRYEGDEASAGGSSGGSALAVASSQCWAALGTDTGGSVRLPAAYTGVVGFKPSYGLLSRWGVIAYANSLDTVGIFARNARIVETVFDKLNVYDPQDPTSLSPSTRSRLGSNEGRSESLRIGIPLEYNIATLHPAVRSAWIRALQALSEKGHTLHPVRLPSTQHALSAYYILAPAEASSNLAKYDGVRFGSRAEGVDGTPESVLFATTRGQGFGSEVQRRILLGAFSLSAQAIGNYFIQAQKIRRLVQQDFNNVFATDNPLGDEKTSPKQAEEGVDVLICPTVPTLAPPLSEVKSQDPIQAYMNDVFTVPASLAGLPAISVPIHTTHKECAAVHGENDIRESAGIQIIGQYGDDKLVLHTADALQSAHKTVQSKAGPDMTAWGTSSLGQSSAKERRAFYKIAVEHGVTIAEARAIGQERDRKKEEVENLLLTILGTRYLDKAAAILDTSREGYMARFVQKDDPVAAEKAFFHNLMDQKQHAEYASRRIKLAPLDVEKAKM